MTIYTEFVTEDQLSSPVNGYVCKRVTKQNIKQFGFDSVEDLHEQYPDFPLLCGSHRKAIGSDPNGLREEDHKNKRVGADRKLRAEYAINPKQCSKCNRTIPFKHRTWNHCSRKCSNGRERSEEAKHKLSLKNRKYKECIQCGKVFYRKNRKTCSKDCFSACKKSRSKGKCSDLQIYRSSCAFKFNVYHYPDEFDLSLLEENGWYKPKNKGDNLTGVSRDHMISVRYGFDNNIDPEIISHPANCQLLIHGDNVSKGTSCDLTVFELNDRIVQWETRYGGAPGNRTL